MDDIFAKRLKGLRQSREMNQVQLAGKLGVTKQSVCNWENDNIMPSVSMLVKVADVFGVTTDYLLGRAGKDVINALDISGLKPHQIEHVRQIVDDIRGS